MAGEGLHCTGKVRSKSSIEVTCTAKEWNAHVQNRDANCFCNTMGFINLFFLLLLVENKACLNRSRAEAGEKVHTISMLWKVPKEFVILEAATDTLSVLEPTVMQGNKIKVDNGAAIAAAATATASGTGRPGSITFLLKNQ